DNVGRILLSIISFQRLKDKYPDDYKGGILAIDEIDATLYPASQVKMLDSLISLCSNISVQIIATTHSLHLLEKIGDLKKIRGRDKQFNTIFLKKTDGEIVVKENPSYDNMVHNLNVTIGKVAEVKKLIVYTEDNECIHFTKAILKRKFKHLSFPEITLGCKNLIQLGQKKIDSFSYPNSVVILDGDARADLNKYRLKNYICLPGDVSPESLLAKFLISLPDKSPFWEEKTKYYSKQICFKDYNLSDITSCRVKAKKWYNQQLDLGAWGKQAGNAFKYLLDTMPEERSVFLDDFEKLYNAILS
ncbi:hypothetical protein DBR07_13405, partial [Aeromonas sp. HMWF036]|uniref:AAA family ATPase n=1 Tax=Aeromonas sp. HMWF036 TaxID=2056869 RepID=UPI000D4F9E8C